jgi:hypothetical protein
LQKPLYRYESSTGHYSWGLSYLNDYNASDAAPYGWLPSNDYRFICQIPQMELANNGAISEKDQNPFSGQ